MLIIGTHTQGRPLISPMSDLVKSQLRKDFLDNPDKTIIFHDPKGGLEKYQLKGCQIKTLTLRDIELSEIFNLKDEIKKLSVEQQKELTEFIDKEQ
ncbi:hypothetical protein RyT2_29520 [Pseudolactococcus yaeyamensis]